MKKSGFLKKFISLVLVATLVVCSGVLNVAEAEEQTLADYSKLDKAIATIPDGPNRTNGVYKTEELEALDAMVASFDRNLTSDEQATVNQYRTDLLAAISALSMDLSRAEATVTVRIDRKLVKKDDIITVFININTNYPVTGIQLPVLYDKTQFTLVDYDSGNSYITFCDGSFKNGSYDLNGNAGLTTGFSNTTDSDKWNNDEARAKYDYAFFTATFNSQKNPSNLKLAVPQDEDFATFRLQAKNDIENAEELVFISPDWVKNDTNKGGTFSVGFSGTVLNRNPLTYVTTGMTYNLVTDSMIPTDSISLNITEATLTKDSSTVQLVASVTPETAVNKKITWTSSDTSVATVDSTGKVTRVGTGETLIKAETPYGQIATCNITVIHQCFAELTLIDEVEAECYTQGNVKYYECTCGKLYSDSSAENEVKEEDIIIPALNHPDDGRLEMLGTDPTHTEDGEAGYWICGYCGDCFADYDCTTKIDEPILLPATGHDDLTNAEWSSDKNSHYKQCSCGEKFEITEHNFEWITENEPTCTDSGSKYEKCTICGFVRSENTPIGLIPHTPELVEGTNSTCTEQGNIAYYECGVCSKLFTDEECADEITKEDINLPVKDHSYEKNVTLPTTTEQGFTTYTCANCGYFYISDYTGPGIEVTGTVYTSAFDTDEVTLILANKGKTESLQILKLTGNETVYTFTDVIQGDYIVTVSKNNHISQTFEFSVIDEEKITLNLEIFAFGDVNCDSEVNILDYTAVLNHAKMIKEINGENFIYADINIDGRISVSDYAMILRHVKKTHSIWK